MEAEVAKRRRLGIDLHLRAPIPATDSAATARDATKPAMLATQPRVWTKDPRQASVGGAAFLLTCCGALGGGEPTGCDRVDCVLGVDRHLGTLAPRPVGGGHCKPHERRAIEHRSRRQKHGRGRADPSRNKGGRSIRRVTSLTCPVRQDLLLGNNQDRQQSRHPIPRSDTCFTSTTESDRLFTRTKSTQQHPSNRVFTP